MSSLVILGWSKGTQNHGAQGESLGEGEVRWRPPHCVETDHLGQSSRGEIGLCDSSTFGARNTSTLHTHRGARDICLLTQYQRIVTLTYGLLLVKRLPLVTWIAPVSPTGERGSGAFSRSPESLPSVCKHASLKGCSCLGLQLESGGHISSSPCWSFDTLSTPLLTSTSFT
jgi:hypothetical protein